MSSSFGTAGTAQGWSKRGCGVANWRPLEIGAMIAGFALWWPLGLAVIGYKVAQKKGLVSRDWFEELRAKAMGMGSAFSDGSNRRWRPFEPTSGNTAFDDWKRAELERLAEERRKLDAAERAFAEHMDNLRKARDREEFDRFMAERRGPNAA